MKNTQEIDKKWRGNSWCKKGLRYVSNNHHVQALFESYFKPAIKKMIEENMKTEYLIILINYHL